MSVTIISKDLSIRFKDRVLFHIPDLIINPNDVIYLKGDNGVGKTTLLKLLAGLMKPTTGKIHCSSNCWWHKWLLNPTHNQVVYLHQSPYLFDGTVYQNVVYGLRYKSLSNHNKRAEIINALRMVGLETLINEHISVLSGGEKQRVAMARAWIVKPSILLMDEPSASLDQESIDQLVTMAQDLTQRGTSLVITSHQTNALTHLCHKQWWIKERTLVESPLLHMIQEKSVILHKETQASSA